MRRTPQLLLTLFAALALVLAACGDDDGDGDGAQQADETADEQAAEDALGNVVGGECAFLAEFAGAFEGFDPTQSAGADGTSIDFGDFYAELASEFQEVADAAPDDIRDAFQTMASSMSQVADELEGIELDFSDPENVDPEALAALDSMGDAFDEEFNAAADEVDAWIQDNCSQLADELELEGSTGGAGG